MVWWWNGIVCVDEMTSWLNGKLMKWKVDERANRWNDKLMKCQVDETARWWHGVWWNCILENCKVNEIACSWNDKLTKEHISEMPSWQNVRAQQFQPRMPILEIFKIGIYLTTPRARRDLWSVI